MIWMNRSGNIDGHLWAHPRPDDGVSSHSPIGIQSDDGPSAGTRRQPGNAGRMVGMISGRNIILCPLAEVCYFEALGKYTRVVAAEGSGLLSLGISRVESQISGERFVRIHRSFLVNLTKVRIVKRDEFRKMRLNVVGIEEEISVSQNYEHLFRAGIF